MVRMDELEIVRGGFFARRGIPHLTIYQDMLSFNNRCVELLGDSEYVNLLVGKADNYIHVRGCRSNDFNAVKWYEVKKGRKMARKIKSRMMIAMLFDRLGYDIGHKYRLIGEYREEVPELVFDTSDPLVYVLKDIDGIRRFEQKYPKDWKDSFGIPLSGQKGYCIKTFEDYTVLDVTLERVDPINEDLADKEAVERMQELKEKYIRGGATNG